MTGSGRRYELRVAGPATRQLDRLLDNVAAAIVEFMLGAPLDDPHRAGGALRRELTGLCSACRGGYRIVCEVHEDPSTVVVLRIDHRCTVYRPH